jgi:hypothetical protein
VICGGGQSRKIGPTERQNTWYNDWDQLRKFEMMDQAFQKMKMMSKIPEG